MVRFVINLRKAEQLGMLFRSPNDHTAAPRTPPPNPGGVQQVHGFTRSDGTVVAPHVRHVAPAPRQTSIPTRQAPAVASHLWTHGPKGPELTEAGHADAYQRATGAHAQTRATLEHIEHGAHNLDRRFGVGWIQKPASPHLEHLRALTAHGLARLTTHPDHGRQYEITPRGTQALEQYRVEAERLRNRVRASTGGSA